MIVSKALHKALSMKTRILIVTSFEKWEFGLKFSILSRQMKFKRNSLGIITDIFLELRIRLVSKT